MRINIYLVRKDIIATVRLHHVLQFAVFSFRSCTRTPSRSVGVGFQDIVPSTHKLNLRSIRDQHGKCGPILATVRLRRILQLDAFI
jgi:hypothetical protein